jgi:hypothetical protein
VLTALAVVVSVGAAAMAASRGSTAGGVGEDSRSRSLERVPDADAMWASGSGIAGARGSASVGSPVAVKGVEPRLGTHASSTMVHSESPFVRKLNSKS